MVTNGAGGLIQALRALLPAGTAAVLLAHLEKPSLVKYFGDPNLQGYAILQKIFISVPPRIYRSRRRATQRKTPRWKLKPQS